MEQREITLNEAAQRTDVSVSTIYHYIKKGLLPEPIRIANRKSGRGALSVYPRTIIEDILRIKKELEKTHSLETVRENIKKPEKDIKESIVKRLGTLLQMAKKGKYNDKEFKRELLDMHNSIGTPSITYTFIRQ